MAQADHELTGSGEWTMQVFEQKMSKTKGRMEEEEEEEKLFSFIFFCNGQFVQNTRISFSTCQIGRKSFGDPCGRWLEHSDTQN